MTSFVDQEIADPFVGIKSVPIGKESSWEKPTAKCDRDLSEFFLNLPHEGIVAATRAFKNIGVMRSNRLPPLRAALLDFGIADEMAKRTGMVGCFVPDIVAATNEPATWEYFRGGIPNSVYHSWRMQQVLHNRGIMGCSFDKGQAKGMPAYICANGPSLTDCVSLFPKKGTRKGLIFAVNGAQSLFGPEMDFWCMKDALWPDGRAEWYRGILEEWRAVDATGVHGFFGLYSNHMAIRDFEKRGGASVSFTNAHNANPYRQLVPEEVSSELPSLVEGLQGVVGVIHFAQWLGCSPIVLFGVDECRHVSGPLHAGGTVGWRPLRPEWEPKWVKVNGLFGEVETTNSMIQALHHIAAECMWLIDAGWPVWNCSRGLDLIYAPYVDPKATIGVLEHGADPHTLEDSMQDWKSLEKLAVLDMSSLKTTLTEELDKGMESIRLAYLGAGKSNA